ncbi:unnamed protein product [Rhizophagus irregularis]|nr:unnamed protein product [Rhizophagus irregularis]
MFAKLCIYAFFLIAITTITIGAPLEVSSKLTSRPAQLEKYGPLNQQSLSRRGHLNAFAQCSHEEGTLLDSYCDKLRTMNVRCIMPDNTIYNTTQQCEGFGICVDYNYNSVKSAICASIPYIRTFYSMKNELTCSSNTPYASGGDLYTGMTTYNVNSEDPVTVYELQTLYKDEVVEAKASEHFITKSLLGYKNNENVQYCFIPGTNDSPLVGAAVALR